MKKKDTAALAALLFIAAAESVLAVGLLKKLQKLAVEKAAAMYPDQLPETEELPEETEVLPETEQLPQADSEDE